MKKCKIKLSANKNENLTPRLNLNQISACHVASTKHIYILNLII